MRLCAGNGVSTPNQTITTCTIPTPMFLAIKAPQLVQCTLSNRIMEVTTSGLQTRNLHMRASVSSYTSPRPKDQFSSYKPSKSSISSNLARPRMAIPTTISTASLHLSKDAHISGFLAHPAIVDSCFHMGATMAADGDEKQSIKTHVPVALDAFNVFAPLKPASHACACAEISAYLTAAPALSTYKMLQKGDQTSYGFELVNLHARAVQLGKAHNEPSVSFSKPTELTYKIEWQYSDVDNQSSTRRRMKNTKLHVWLDITSGRPLMMRARIASSAAASCLMDIAIIREVLKQPTSRTKTGLSSPYKLGHDEIARENTKRSYSRKM